MLLIGIGVDLDITLDEGSSRAGVIGATWVPFLGPIDALNRTLATLSVRRTSTTAKVLVLVDDRGHGDTAQRRGAAREIPVVDP